MHQRRGTRNVPLAVETYIFVKKQRTVRGEVVTNFGSQKLIPKLGSFPEPKKMKTNENETVNLQA